MQPSLLKRIRHWLEWGLAKVSFGFFKLLPLTTASNIGGWIGRNFGPLLKVNRVARRNLKMAFPDWDDEKINQTIVEMWDNLGRYAGEFAQIARMSSEDFSQICELEGNDVLQAAGKLEKGSLYYSCHMANWELGAKASAGVGVPFSVVYRPLNNPLVDRIANWHRDHYQTKGIPKTGTGGRELLTTIKKGGRVAILIDQKMRTGIPVPFFGHDAMTTTSIADLALKYGCPIYPVRVERLGRKPQFKVTVQKPLEYEKTGDAEKDVLTIMNAAHAEMENWIRERPEQWFWLHKRWG